MSATTVRDLIDARIKYLQDSLLTIQETLETLKTFSARISPQVLDFKAEDVAKVHGFIQSLGDPSHD